MPDISTIAIALATGILPVLIWLWFWLLEDSAHPEPRRLIVYAFLAGMATVAIVVPIELFVRSLVEQENVMYTIWSVIEEVFKYAAASIVVLWRHEDDEPIDPVIYMIVIGLGFAAAENVLFLLSPISGTTTFETLLSGNFRFMGATLLHVLSSATIGMSLGLAFYKSPATRHLYALTGIALACLVHAIFNFAILHAPSDHLILVFEGVWIGILVLLGMLEYVKRIRPLSGSAPQTTS